VSSKIIRLLLLEKKSRKLAMAFIAGRVTACRSLEIMFLETGMEFILNL
jgi:hypothetical protein